MALKILIISRLYIFSALTFLLLFLLSSGIVYRTTALATTVDIQPYNSSKTIAASASSVSISDKLLSERGIKRGGSDKRTGLAEFSLKSNGLTVLLKEQHSAPVVTVAIVYRVGSRNEAVGYTGATHFLEHMMFKGSSRYDPLKEHGIEDVLKPVGGINNASTWFDRTSYFNVVPATSLPLCLDFEADRMRHLLLRQTDRNSEMTVVRNEMERNRNDPRTVLETQLLATAFREHPYHHPTIGWRSDVEGVPLKRLRQFYDEFYWPDNATLIVLGDFNSSNVLSEVTKIFGKIPHSPHPATPVYTTEPPQEGERRFIVQHGTGLPRVEIGFHTCAASNADIYPLAVAESILGDSSKQSSRLYKALVDTGLASEAYAYSYELHDPGLFEVSATITPGTPSAKVEQAILGEVNKLKSQPIDMVELERAKTAITKKILLAAVDPVGLAELIGESVAAANWQYLTGYPDKIRAVTAQDIMQVTNKYFADNNKTVGNYLPKEQPSASEPQSTQEMPTVVPPGIVHLKSDCSKADAVTTPRPAPLSSNSSLHADATAVPAGASTTHRSSISSQVVRKVLANGLVVEVLPVKGIGVVSVAGKIRAGDYFTSTDKSLLPSALAEMLSKGSAKYSREDMANELENMGTSLSFEPHSFWIAFNSDVVSTDLPRFLCLLCDILRNPALPPDELVKSKTVFASIIKEHMSDTHECARNALAQHLYKSGCVYYEKSFSDQLKELPAMSVEDLRSFHDAYYSPANTTLAIVGDVEPSTAFKLVEAEFGKWSGPAAHHIEKPEVQLPAAASKTIVTLPDKENVDMTIGCPVDLSIKSKDYYAVLLGNAALGHSPFSTRLSPVRERYGYCYNIYSTILDTSYGGAPWIIECTVNPKNAEKTHHLIESLVANYLKTGISENELHSESKHLAGEFLVDLRTPGEIAHYLTRFEILGLTPKFFDEFPVRLGQVTKSEADRAIRKYFSLDHADTVMAGSLSK